MRSSFALLILALGFVLGVSTVASATWSPATLASDRDGEQAFGDDVGGDGSTQPDLTPDGRYVVFSTTARNLVAVPEVDPAKYRRGGIVRRDLTTGRLALVAPGARSILVRPFAEDSAGASRPSISASGRFVAFETDDALRPGLDTNGRVDVYVRDMDRAIDDPAAFELISARDGSAGGANFDAANARQGARSGRPAASISDDGNRVLFVVPVASDLAGVVTSTQAFPTPAGQLFVRDRDRQATIPVNVERDERSGLPTEQAVGGAVAQDLAALSADGSSVVWLSTGEAAVRQTQTLAGESAEDYEQLLHRRIGGPAPPIRRVAAAADVDDPDCPSNGRVSSQRGPAAGPCDGPFAIRNDPDIRFVDGSLALSGDGRKVAWTTAWAVRAQPDLTAAGSRPDIMLAEVVDGRSRKSTFREITRSEPIAQPAFTDLAFSADGNTLVVGSSSLTLPLPRPAFIGAPPLDLFASQLYAINLRQDTIEVLTRGVGEASPKGVSGGWAPALSADGSRVAFTTAATNLVAEDGNGLSDVFTSDVVAPSVRAVGQQVPPRRSAPPLVSLPRLRVTARPAAGGRIRITAIVPRAGVIAAALPGRTPSSGRPLARVSARAAASGAYRLTIGLPKRLRRQAGRSGLVVRVAVTFTAADGQRLRRDVRCVFTVPRRSASR